MTFDELVQQWTWKPIRNCPGRFVLAAGPDEMRTGTGVQSVRALSPRDLAGPDSVLSTFQVAAARDVVVVGPLDTGGLISYRRRDGTYVHTLNTADGFARKLQQLGIVLSTGR